MGTRCQALFLRLNEIEKRQRLGITAERAKGGSELLRPSLMENLQANSLKRAV